jgi:hypothetical protein
MTNKILSCGTIVLLAAAGIGCSSGTPASEMSFCAQKAEKECGTDTKGVAVSCGATVAACKAVRAAACAAWIPSQESATRPFRPENIGNCLNKTTDAYASVTVLPAKRAAMDEACARVFSGRGAMLAACTSSFDCATDLICDPNASICVKKTITNSAFCGDPGSVCPANQYCTLVGMFRTCVANKAAGQACSATDPCIAGLRCSGGICTDRVGVNLACGSDDDCAAEAPYCDPYSTCRCRPGFTPTIGATECAAFGATDVTVVPQVCSGAGGAGGSPGSAGSTGAAGSPGTAGSAGGTAGGVGGAGGAG